MFPPGSPGNHAVAARQEITNCAACHDKGAQTAKRVAYTETLNLPTQDAAKAMKVMAWTAAHASDIRQSAVAAAAKAAGLPYDEYVRLTNPFRGRKGSKCVYAYSLAWSPEQDPVSRTVEDSGTHGRLCPDIQAAAGIDDTGEWAKQDGHNVLAAVQKRWVEERIWNRVQAPRIQVE